MNKIKKFTAYSTLAGLITIGAFVNHSSNEVDKNSKAAQKLETVLLSQCFETEILSSCLDENQTNGLSKKEVVEKLKSSPVTIELQMYRSWRGVVGYTYDGTNKIWMNRKFHDGFNVCDSAANMGHEISHKMGFKHDFNYTKRRSCSVPYIIGTVINKCCKENYE